METTACQHPCFDHLFTKSSCSSIGICERIGIIFFHVITLGIPYLLSLCFTGTTNSEHIAVAPQGVSKGSGLFSFYCANAKNVKNPPTTFQTSLQQESIDLEPLKEVATPDRTSYPTEALEAILWATQFSETHIPKSDFKEVLEWHHAACQRSPFRNMYTEALDVERVEKILQTQHFEPWREPLLNLYPPVNQEISRLTALYKDYFIPRFYMSLEKNGEAAWEQIEVIKAFDELLKMAYTIGCLTLEGLEEHANELRKQKEMEGSLVDLLVNQQSYNYKSFFYCPFHYHHATARLYYSKENTMDFGDLNRKRFSQDYFTTGSVKSQWRTLFNHYCDLVSNTIPRSELEKKDARYSRWTEKDTKRHFTSCPDTLPT